MGFINFGNRFKNRQFDYIPRYYDEVKEERERLKRMYSSDVEKNTEEAKERIKIGFRKKYRVTEDAYKGNARRKSNRILMYVMIGLLAICYIFLTRYLPAMAERIGN